MSCRPKLQQNRAYPEQSVIRRARNITIFKYSDGKQTLWFSQPITALGSLLDSGKTHHLSPVTRGVGATGVATLKVSYPKGND